MRITAPSLGAILLTGALLFGQDATPPWYNRLAKLAMYISSGDAVSALESFDKNMPRYGVIAEDLQALAAQADVTCSIDPVSDKEADDALSDVHHLDLDWFVMLKSRLDPNLVERRRQRVAVTMHLFKSGSGPGAWRITSLAPETILAPIVIR
jgi:hypothetical protein